VIEAEDGNEAIEKLRAAENIDVIVSDWVMPNKDGYELLLWVRSNEKYRNVPFIMATARGEKKQVTKAIEAGVTDFITKPFSANELLELIQKVFEAKDKPEQVVVPKVMKPRKTTAGKLLLKVSHIQITDHLALGVLKHLIATGKLEPQHFELETVIMPSWNPVQQTLERGEVDAAFILAPIAMDLFSFGVPIKLVLLAHKNGSIFVRKRSEDSGKSLAEFFRNKTFYLPHELSVHHMLSHMFLRGLGLRPGFRGRGDFDTFFEVVPPINMPEYLAKNPEAGGYLVAEPLGTKAIAEGIADLTFLSGEFWENHPCCVVAMRDEIVQQYPEAVQELVTMLVQAGQFIKQKPETAAAIGVPFLDPNRKLGLKESVLRDVLKEAQGIKTNDMFPVIEDLDRLQRYMVNEVGIGSLIDLNKFVDIRFAEVACKGLVGQKSVLHDVSEIVATLASHQAGSRGAKANLNLEGKYLSFIAGNGEFAFNVSGVKEITEMKPVTVVPHAPAFVKGVINLRGEIVPIIDLGYRLGMAASEYNKHARIIIVEVATNKGTIPVGIAVNSVSDVIDIEAKDIEEVSAIERSAQAGFILGYAKTNEKVRILLDTARLFGEV
jgi:chemotaxis signal transduction protein/ABC-type nitrate/sulfonate/bicarbonate transport system substrate-binding protein/CheY-like chemotaxis protein